MRLIRLLLSGIAIANNKDTLVTEEQCLCWGVARQGLASEDSTRAVAKGTPFMPTPQQSANSEQSRRAVLLEAPLDIEYDVEVDCTT